MFDTAVYSTCLFSVHPQRFCCVTVDLDWLCISLYGRNDVFRASRDMMSKWENALRNTVLQYVIVALYSLLDLRLIVSLTSFRSLFSVGIFFLFFWARVDSSDRCVACDCHFFMHQCSGIYWFLCQCLPRQEFTTEQCLFVSPWISLNFVKYCIWKEKKNKTI